jgi:hypothetical protein
VTTGAHHVAVMKAVTREAFGGPTGITLAAILGLGAVVTVGGLGSGALSRFARAYADLHQAIFEVFGRGALLAADLLVVGLLVAVSIAFFHSFATR